MGTMPEDPPAAGGQSLRCARHRHIITQPGGQKKRANAKCQEEKRAREKLLRGCTLYTHTAVQIYHQRGEIGRASGAQEQQKKTNANTYMTCPPLATLSQRPPHAHVTHHADRHRISHNNRDTYHCSSAPLGTGGRRKKKQWRWPVGERCENLLCEWQASHTHKARKSESGLACVVFVVFIFPLFVVRIGNWGREGKRGDDTQEK